jgi:hypothetical protein
MTANELRIGNLIYLPKGLALGTCKTAEFDELVEYKVQAIYVNWDFENIAKPILLIEEWLIKFGFNKSEYYPTFSNNSNYCIVYREEKYDVEGGYYIQNDSTSDAWCYMMMDKPIKYVHHLQNLWFALTDKELTVNEKP